MSAAPEDVSRIPVDVSANSRSPLLLALLGHPVGHSLSPLMHSAALRHLQIEGSYEAWDVTDLKQAMDELRRRGFRGASVTIPYKTAVMAFLDGMDEQASSIGAVNTLIRQGEQLLGTNTDWEGLIRALRRVTEIRGHSFVILGAGGTARAALYGLLREGGLPMVVNRTEERGLKLADEFGCSYSPLTDIEHLEGDVLINTTSVGMAPNVDSSLVPANVFEHFRFVADVIYNPLKTRLLRDAEQAGCGVLSGVEMFVEQGAAQFRLWTGLEPPVALMWQVVRDQLKQLEKGTETRI